mgnify:CR=1 FL=1
MKNTIWLKTYAVQLNLAADWQRYLPYVSPARQQQAVKFLHHADAVRTIFGELLTRAAIVELLRCDNASIQFTAGKYGKPALQDAPNFHFNIAHAGDWVVGAFANVPVGIDVECVGPAEDTLATAVMSATELSHYLPMAEPERSDYFYRIWSLKESFLKATGQGLSDDPATITIKQDAQGRLGFWQDNRRHLCSLQELPFDCRYRAALCLLAEQMPPVQMEYKTMPGVSYVCHCHKCT